MAVLSTDSIRCLDLNLSKLDIFLDWFAAMISS